MFFQINYWFLVNELADRTLDLFRVFPTNEVSGFGNSDSDDLKKCFQQPVKLSAAEKEKISTLWKSYRLSNNFIVTDLEKVRNLEELAEANANRFNGELLSQLKNLKTKTENFTEFFRAFQKQFPIYGFGDLQVKTLWDNL